MTPLELEQARKAVQRAEHEVRLDRVAVPSTWNGSTTGSCEPEIR